MSEREKKLLIFLGVTFFIILNFVGLNAFYLPIKQKAESARQTAEREFTNHRNSLALAEEIEPEMAWLERSGTTTTTPTLAQSKLQTVVRKQAAARRLEIVDSKIIPAQSGQHFDRVKVLCRVKGDEREIISWVNAIHQVNQRQVVTKFKIEPQKTDITKVEVEAEIEKWIIPVPPES